VGLLTDNYANRPKHIYNDLLEDRRSYIERIFGSGCVARLTFVNDVVPQILHAPALINECDRNTITTYLCDVQIRQLLKETRQKISVAIKTCLPKGVLYDDVSQTILRGHMFNH
jgi:hypothetical protein